MAPFHAGAEEGACFGPGEGEGEVCLSVSGAGERPVLGPVGVGTTG